MAERSLRTRLKDSSGSGRNYAEALHWGHPMGASAALGSVDVAVGLMPMRPWPPARLEREYADEMGVPIRNRESIDNVLEQLVLSGAVRSIWINPIRQASLGAAAPMAVAPTAMPW